MKNFILVLFVALGTAMLSAQNPEVVYQPLTSSFAAQTEQLFGQMNMTEASTGFLLDRAIEFINPELYNGRVLSDSTNLDISMLRFLHGTLAQAKVNNINFPATSPFLDNNVAGNYAIVLLATKFNYIRADAVDRNLLRAQDNRFYDVAGRTMSPYLVDTLFAAACTRYDMQSLQIPFKLPSEKVFTNFGTAISTMSVDWGNGAGYQTYSVGQSVVVTYPNAGKKLVTMRYVASNGRTLQTRFAININLPLNVGIDIRGISAPCTTNEPNYISNCNHEDFTVTATRTFEGIAASAKVDIFYACNDMKLRKPLIILDGFDPNPFRNDADFNAILELMTFRGTPTSQRFGIDIKADGYDLIFVDWNDGRTFIQRNAFLLQEILRQINQRKALSGSSESNVLVGLSMGGVVGKFALRDLELLNPNDPKGGHDVRLFIGYDSPMQGANIPLGMQWALKDVNDVIDAFGIRDMVRNANGEDGIAGAQMVVNSPAARQLLTQQRSEASSLHQSFYNQLNNMGNLQKCDYRHISNGSLLRRDIFNAGADILSVSLNRDTWNVHIWGFIRRKFSVNVVVRSVAPNTRTEVYRGDYSIAGSGAGVLFVLPILRTGVVATSLSVRENRSFALDHAAGGMTSLGTDLFTPLIAMGATANLTNPNFAFIPSMECYRYDQSQFFECR